MVEYMDVLVGQTMSKLDELGVRENTLVLFVGDNGTNGNLASKMADGRTIVGGKGELTDAGTHVPMIAYWKGRITGGQVRDDLVDTTDFLPTIAEATGAALPTPPGDGKIDGHNFLPLVKGRTLKPRDWVLMDYRAGMREAGGRKDGRMVRDQRWKLYGLGRDGSPMYQSGKLFDMKADPEEKTPVEPGNAEGDAARKRLQAVLDQMKSAG
jgi:arylsulfatase A